MLPFFFHTVIKNYAVPRETETRIRQVLTHWRYWMDQDGFDGMCFWSENHCLMFYTGAMLAGEMYPEEFFPLAHKAGKELFSWGRDRIRDWLDDVEKWGCGRIPGPPVTAGQGGGAHVHL